MSLLKAGSGQSHDGTEEMRQNAERLSDTLQSFGIEAHIINVTRGPSVTRYELELQRGVKLSKVTNLADDIALALGASGVRIAAIPDQDLRCRHRGTEPDRLGRHGARGHRFAGI